MQPKELVNRTAWDSLAEDRRQELLRQIGEHMHMSLVRFETFTKWGQSTSTAVYEYQGSEFVFVPGDTVTIGWDSFVQGMDQQTEDDIREEMEEYGVEEELEDYIRSMMTPVRTVVIKPMLVERWIKELGWEPIELDDPLICENGKVIQSLEEFRNSSYSVMEWNDEVKFVRKDGAIEVYRYVPTEYQEFVSYLLGTGFHLPTMEEWEYLCGGGTRTLFPWGDSFDFSLHIRHFETQDEKGLPYDLEEPNFFGLSIGYDPYQMELITGESTIFKGGDGGCYVCGGMGPVVGYLPCAPYYFYQAEEYGVDLEDIGGDYSFYRRVKYVEDLL